MTPVATLAAVMATTWDAALAETLSRAADRPSATTAAGASIAPSGIIHSVHRRAANILAGDRLIALVCDEFDDAPWTVRLSTADWDHLELREGAPVELAPGEIRVGGADGQRIVLSPDRRWAPTAVDPAAVDASALVAAHGVLSLFRAAAPQTPFGRASASLLSAGIEQLRVAVLASVATGIDDAGIGTAVDRLIGLGEGLTPSGDDVLTGLSFLAAQPGMHLNRIVPALARAVEAGAGRTTLLSTATIRSALAARGRQSMHDLAHALATPDSEAFRDAAGRILAIGHSSGADMLTGMRLALELEAESRTTLSAGNRKAIA